MSFTEDLRDAIEDYTGKSINELKDTIVNNKYVDVIETHQQIKKFKVEHPSLSMAMVEEAIGIPKNKINTNIDNYNKYHKGKYKT